MKANISLFMTAALISCSTSQDEAALPVVEVGPAFFIAFAEREESAPLAWLLSVDPTGTGGTFYAPGGSSSLCAWNPAGDTLRWAAGRFSFEGVSIDDSTWIGTVVPRGPVAPSQARASWRTTVYRLPNLSDDDPAVGRVYSTIHVNRETGDLLGAELVLLRVREELWALVALAEGTASLPWVVQGVGRRGDSIGLRVVTAYGTVPIEAEFRSDGLMASIGVSGPEFLRDTTSVALQLANPVSPPWPCG